MNSLTTQPRTSWFFSLAALFLIMTFIEGCGRSDGDQIRNVVTTFCNDLGSHNTADAFNQLSQSAQYQLETPDVMLRSMASAIFDTNFRQQHPNYSTGFSGGQYSVTGCTLTSEPLTNGGQAKIRVHFTFSDNSYSPAELVLNNTDGQWKIGAWGYDMTGCSFSSCP